MGRREKDIMATLMNAKQQKEDLAITVCSSLSNLQNAAIMT